MVHGWKEALLLIPRAMAQDPSRLTADHHSAHFNMKVLGRNDHTIYPIPSSRPRMEGT